jgi:hypothetical protein
MRNRTGFVTANLGYRLVDFDQDGASVPLSTANAGEHSSCAWHLLASQSERVVGAIRGTATDSEQDIAGRTIVSDIHPNRPGSLPSLCEGGASTSVHGRTSRRRRVEQRQE